MNNTRYDDSNIFMKIINGEIPCNKIYESENVIAFEDINPMAETHVLVIPKKKYVSFNDFTKNATNEEISDFFRSVQIVADVVKISESGYRIVSNIGANAHQSVFHFHMHLLAGKNLQPML